MESIEREKRLQLDRMTTKQERMDTEREKKGESMYGMHSLIETQLEKGMKKEWGIRWEFVLASERKSSCGLSTIEKRREEETKTNKKWPDKV